MFLPTGRKLFRPAVNLNRISDAARQAYQPYQAYDAGWLHGCMAA